MTFVGYVFRHRKTPHFLVQILYQTCLTNGGSPFSTCRSLSYRFTWLVLFLNKKTAVPIAISTAVGYELSFFTLQKDFLCRLINRIKTRFPVTCIYKSRKYDIETRFCTHHFNFALCKTLIPNNVFNRK